MDNKIISVKSYYCSSKEQLALLTRALSNALKVKEYYTVTKASSSIAETKLHWIVEVHAKYETLTYLRGFIDGGGIGK